VAFVNIYFKLLRRVVFESKLLKLLVSENTSKVIAGILLRTIFIFEASENRFDFGRTKVWGGNSPSFSEERSSRLVINRKTF
jgi:hypothetical protein